MLKTIILIASFYASFYSPSESCPPPSPLPSPLPSPRSSTSNPHPRLQNQESNTTTVEETRAKDPFLKRILVVDDEPDVTLTFKVGLERFYYHDNNGNKIRFEVYTYNNPLVALSNFKPNFYYC